MVGSLCGYCGTCFGCVHPFVLPTDAQLCARFSSRCACAFVSCRCLDSLAGSGVVLPLS